jgi:PiT family inorganic phosphate transporter
MEYAAVFITLAIIFALFMTWGVGANDVANAMGTSVGSGAITVRKAILIAAVFEFAGAFLAGGHVTGTIRKGIIDASYVPAPEILVWGMLSALLAAGVWLMVASYYGWPVSTTHTIVGALVGFGIVALEVDAVEWQKVGSILASWLISPILGGCIAFFLTLSVRRFILDTDDPFGNAKRVGPVYVFLMGILITLITLFKGL